LLIESAAPQFHLLTPAQQLLSIYEIGLIQIGQSPPLGRD
jgi:hypothetical protein